MTCVYAFYVAFQLLIYFVFLWHINFNSWRELRCLGVVGWCFSILDKRFEWDCCKYSIVGGVTNFRTYINNMQTEILIDKILTQSQITSKPTSTYKFHKTPWSLGSNNIESLNVHIINNLHIVIYQTTYNKFQNHLDATK